MCIRSMPAMAVAFLEFLRVGQQNIVGRTKIKLIHLFLSHVGSFYRLLVIPQRLCLTLTITVTLLTLPLTFT